MAVKKLQHLKPFAKTLSEHGLQLTRGQTDILQVNLGLFCDQRCRHCHLYAGPHRHEMMDKKTMDAVAVYGAAGGFRTVDITGGAPELNPFLDYLLEQVMPFAATIMVRSNLTAVTGRKQEHLMGFLTENKVVIVASFPSINEAQTTSQRGDGVFKKSLETLKKLNSMGYGREGSGLVLNLVLNPAGAFLPPSQAQTEKRFRSVLENRWGIVFNQLYTFANVPLGRFKKWLIASDNYEAYMAKLTCGFNPCAVEGLMCRTLVSVSWDGFLYDCDFNLAAGLPMGGKKTHVSQVLTPPAKKSPIAVSESCYTCTVGAGFT